MRATIAVLLALVIGQSAWIVKREADLRRVTDAWQFYAEEYGKLADAQDLLLNRPRVTVDLRVRGGGR